jgi:hypothetical protein
MEELAIGADFECAATRRDQGERFNALAEFENLGRQTDGLRRVVSDDAVFDRYFGFHRELLSISNVSAGKTAVKVCAAAGAAPRPLQRPRDNLPMKIEYGA